MNKFTTIAAIWVGGVGSAAIFAPHQVGIVAFFALLATAAFSI